MLWWHVRKVWSGLMVRILARASLAKTSMARPKKICYGNWRGVGGMGGEMEVMALLVMVYIGRLCLKGVPFSGFRFIKG